ncbi:MAG: FAD-dependent oxidoreductase [Opitutales bacterium]|nr:FAD-dependent oxidoreductase [Opitutales bacterium]
MDSTNIADIVLPVEQSDNQSFWKAEIARIWKIKEERIQEMRLLKHSIDARQRVIKAQLRIEVGIDQVLPPSEQYTPLQTTLPQNAPTVIIVGTGPGGLFAALRCLEKGHKPILLERGKDVSARRYDLAPILRKGYVIEDSNYCFGEGGAGTFSDGKLYTRAKKRGPVRSIYETFVAHGAPEQILIDAHPHIGSNLLPNVVKAIRQTIISCGGEVHFNSKVTGLLFSSDQKQIRGVTTSNGDEFTGKAVILATGHSARDIYSLLARESVLLEAKTFAVGVRIEHPQSLIDHIQYHLGKGQQRPKQLPAASYNVAATFNGRGVHSFCMCPGGFIVPAVTENDEIVVNGMSLSRRDSPYANSGFVVTVTPEDTDYLQNEFGILSGIAFQKQLEVKASQAGGGMMKAPAQRVQDFLREKLSDDNIQSSYHPGTTSAPLHEILPEFITRHMQYGLQRFEQNMPGFTGNNANLIGVETRTSSPLRIPRKPETLEHVALGNFYPCGEGAGYAGGIVSAALDGLNCAEAACSKA